MVAPAEVVCLLCHQDVAPDPDAVSIHAPAEDSCLDCHVPHGGKTPGFLSQELPGLCFQCHDDASSEFRSAHLERDPLTLDCNGCHEPHHASEKSLLRPTTHPPFDRDCTTCHEDRRPIADQASLCTMCHDGLPDPEDDRQLVHAPFADGACSDCHNPHAGRGPALARTPRLASTCGECHDTDDLMPDPALAHTPVRNGDCAACHLPHASAHAALLQAPAEDICWSCHQDLQAQQQWSHVHEPFADGDCSGCHSPHGTEHAQTLVDAPQVLCAACHDVQDPALKEGHRGFEVTAADCSGCHTPHASQDRGLPHPVVHAPFGAGDCNDCHQGTDPVPALDQPDLCFSCHAGFAADLGTGRIHAPVAEVDGCSLCHAPHTSANQGLLRSAEVNLCSRCHETEAEACRSADHAHPVVDGKTCTVCHDPHLTTAGGQEPQTVRREVCLDCHSYQEHADHPMGEDVLDPRTGSTMLCNSCHAPHGSAFEKFMTDDASGRLCVQCHTDKLRQRR
jgi:predicted CXXCH cytochrome family protein